MSIDDTGVMMGLDQMTALSTPDMSPYGDIRLIKVVSISALAVQVQHLQN